MLKAISKNKKQRQGSGPKDGSGDDATSRSHAGAAEEQRDRDQDEEDGVVMVMFPMRTWREVQDMAKSRGVTTGEIMSVALEVLKEKMEAGDGAGGR